MGGIFIVVEDNEKNKPKINLKKRKSISFLSYPEYPAKNEEPRERTPPIRIPAENRMNKNPYSRCG